MTAGNVIVADNVTKLHRLNNVLYREDVLYLIGIAGAMSDVYKILDFLATGAAPDSGFEHDVGAVIVGARFIYHLEPDTTHLMRYKRDTFLVEGSGGPFALSAMRLGLDAKAAVEHAKKMDIYSGGKVKVISGEFKYD